MVIDTMVNDLVTDGGESIEVPENYCYKCRDYRDNYVDETNGKDLLKCFQCGGLLSAPENHGKGFYRFVRLVGERIDTHYRLKGLPKGKDFRKESSYVELKASWLKVEGVGFAGDSFEFSEHETDIVVCQEVDGGSAHIYFEPFISQHRLR